MKISVSTLIDAPVTKVWSIVRPFDSLSVWHPYVAQCEIENGRLVDQVGAIRRITLEKGEDVVRETLLALSDLEHEIVYDIIESGMPLQNYISTLTFRSATEWKTYAYWETHCDPDEGASEKVGELLTDIYQSGFGKLNELAKHYQNEYV